MKNIRVIAFIIIIFSIIVVLINIVGRRTYKLTEKDMNLDKLLEERDAIVELTKKYLKTLNMLKDKVRQIGDRLENKLILARQMERSGDMLNEKQLWDLALKNYSIGLELLPQDPYLNYKMGLVLSNMGTLYFSNVEDYWGKAETYYLNSIKFSPSFSSSYYGLALLYLNYYEKNINKNKLNDALFYINKYINLNSKDPKAYFVKGRILYLMGNKNMAIEAYNSILNIVKESSPEYNNALKIIKEIKGEM